jgi:hypothetical protein
MPTPFVNTVFYVLVTLNNAGQLAAVEKADMPPGAPGPIAFSEGQCMTWRGKMADPSKFTCQPFTSPKSTAWTPEGATGAVAPPPPQENLQPDTSPERRSDGSLEPPPAAVEINPSQRRVTRQSEPPSAKVMYPVFFQIVRGYAGMATPTDHKYGSVSFLTAEGCSAAVASRPHPENYYCLRYESAKTIPYIFPENLDDDSSKAGDAKPSQQAPRVEPQPEKLPPEKRRDAQRKQELALAGARQQQQPQHRRQFDPIGAIASLFMPRDW